MALIGVLLGITMSALVAACYFGYKRSTAHEAIAANTIEQICVLRDRLRVLESRKAYAVEAREYAASTSAAGTTVGKVGLGKMRTWNEDIGAAE